MPDITQTLLEILQTVQRPGDFHISGKQEIFAPNISVDGVGAIALPLLQVQAEQLIAIAEQAPYGRGEQTLIDTEVRRTWQISPEKIQMGGRHWAENLHAIVARCAAGLGVQEPVVAEFYKMLVYDTGGFFVGHRDTEKAPGMFATLVIVLPSIYTGGELLVRHQEREVRLDLSSQDASELAFAAFYADCWHEVRPVASGCRLTLIYNLIRQGKGALPRPPAYDDEIDRLAALLLQWTHDLDSAPGTRPQKLIYPLEHIYTPAEISFSSLKNADAAIAAVLQQAALGSDCELHLALVSISESGSAEATGYYQPRGYYKEPEPEGYEIYEVCERDLSLSAWCAPDGSCPALLDLPFQETELCPPDSFADAEPDEQEFFEATGNAGASFERSYRRAAFVLWPKSGKLRVIAGAGLAVSLPYLVAQTDCCQASGTDPNSELWQETHQLATEIIKSWSPVRQWRTTPGEVSQLLTCLYRLQDRRSILRFLTDISANGIYGAGDNAALSTAACLLLPGETAELIEKIIHQNLAQHEACTNLLYQVAIGLAEKAVLLGAAARALVHTLPGDPALAQLLSPENGWRQHLAATPALISDLFGALHLIGCCELGQQVLAHVLAWPRTFPLDTTVLPGALVLRERLPGAIDWLPIRDLNAACLRHLARRIAEPLEAPADFTRCGEISCQCANCKQLAAFLIDAQRKEWVFSAAEALRRHVEETIQRDKCDLDTVTARHTRPYQLVCHKNQASYQRRVAQRQRDFVAQARLSS